MRAVIAIALVAACSHPAPPPAPPRGPTACARAADAMVQTLLDRLPAKDAPPTEAADGYRNLIRERCERDAWSDEATRCLAAMKTTADAEPCAKLLTEAQQAALVQDGQALSGGPKPEANGGPAGSGSAGDPAGPPR